MTRDGASFDDPILEVDRLLVDRARLCLHLILAGVAVVCVGWIVMHPGDRPLISVVHLVNLLAVAVALHLVRDPARRTFNCVVGFSAYAVTIVATGAVGVLTSDVTTPLLILVGMAVFAATLVPWSPWWQLGSVALTIATATWTVAAVVTSPRLFWLQSVGAIAPTLLATVAMSHAIGRQRARVEHAERQRRSREEGLREANQRLQQEIEEHRKTEAALRFAMRELDHRVKNTLATVQSVADQTLRSSVSMREFGAAFSGRIWALARIHTALAGRRWEGLPLSELVELVVGPYRPRTDSLSLDCNGTFVSSEMVRVLGMALHELATNAAKYGALSTERGRVAVSSHVDGERAGRLCIRWSECGGPRVNEPTHRGFGMRLIEEAIAYEVDGQVTIGFPGQGLHCELEIPLFPASMSAAQLSDMRVLIVEDNFVVADALRYLIDGHAGLVSSIVPSLERASAALAAEPVDIAVLDVNLNGASVLPFAEHLHARGLPFVFLTGYGDEQLLPEHLRVHPRFGKPVDAEPFVRALREFGAKHRAQRSARSS